FFLELKFDENGNLSLGSMVYQDQMTIDAGAVAGMTKERFLEWIGVGNVSVAMLETPKNVSVYLYSTNADCYHYINGEAALEDAYFNWNGEALTQIRTIYLLILLILTVCAFLLPVFKHLRRENELIHSIPMEAAVIGVLLAALMEGGSGSLCAAYAYGSWDDNWLLNLIGNILFYLLVFGGWFVSVMVLFQVFDLGVKKFIREKSLIWRTVNRLYGGGKGMIRHFMDSLKTIDLTDRSDRWLFKIVSINFIILFFCCILWFWGVFGLLVYSVILFFLLRKYLNRVKKDYEILQKSVSQMAQGNLQMDIPQNLGLFEPMKEELAKVNSGFKKAVEEEIKSQNMKTELITNVSHDLKTPLTAIITYVNLLKEENTTPEERKSYVDILDRKSMRLKNLIEDLFEVSKASSGNIKIEKTQIDLGEMVHQAAAEQEDRMQEAKVECRVSVPETRVLMMLDGEKTYRILENLLVNVTKYAMPGTRAWLSLTETARYAEIVLKNISVIELPEDVSQLTERFIRGDKARNTEGSGLGLAIVRSFTELQGGTFQIQVDGDLFKAIVRFPK
ncbi:MAG: HAMP domain-containing sensor histidine kinase, partial [Lachnospiraceae bacterium]|nr:HAMP domain-containing sensor histidine kinase [Lachnospiraceae bacterium]